MKKCLTLICLICLFCTFKIPANACWAWGFENVHELINGKPSENAPGAVLILTGTVIDAELTHISGQPVTLTSVKITELIKGNVSTDSIITAISTGHDWSLTDPDEPAVSSSVDGPFLTLGQDYLLFLWESHHGENNYGFAGANRGAFIIDGEQVINGEYMEMATLDAVRAAAERGDVNPVTGVAFGAGLSLIAGTAAVVLLITKKGNKHEREGN
jgi:hypothetical protein